MRIHKRSGRGLNRCASANRRAGPASVLAETKAGDDGLDLGGLHLRLPAALGGDLGLSQQFGPVPLLQALNHHAELRVRQDAGQGEERRGGIAQAGSQELIRGAGAMVVGVPVASGLPGKAPIGLAAVGAPL